MKKQSTNQYLNSLIDSINQKRIISTKEFGKADIYKESSTDPTYDWYEKIIECVNDNPPSFCVKKIIVKQCDEKIISIDYIYAKSTDELFQFVISVEDIADG